MNRHGLILLAVGLASGCAPMPQTPDEYRELVSEGAFGRAAKTYAVDRPYSEVASTLEAKAEECFNVKLVETTCIDRSCYDRNVFYKPTLVKGPERTELHIQWRREPGDAFSFSGKPPADGMYVVVADAMPAGKGRTTMTVYAPTMVFTVIPKAIKHWANGTNLGCPDLTKGQNSP